MTRPTLTQICITVSTFLIPLSLYFLFGRSHRPPNLPIPPPTKITKLFIYPIKSCHGIRVPSAQLLPTGLDLDRQWMWVKHPERKFLTIREHAKMTLIRPTYNAETDTLTITAPAPNPGAVDNSTNPLSFSIPAHPTTAWLAENTTVVAATIWTTTTPSHEYSPTLTAPFNAFFGTDVRLVYKPPVSPSPRALNGNGKKELLGRAASTCFADLMPVLVGSEASLAELNTRLHVQGDSVIDATRFRPNILVQGHEPWSEDRWKTIRVTALPAPHSTLTLDVVARCARCHVPNVDPETAEAHARQPWDTLMKYRRVDPGITFKPCFGMLCVPRGSGAEINVDMQVEVVEVTEKHRYVKGMG
ncbi:MOSC-domain-containing protein [Glonium stellatum]|uniref:MOSC-domain-containing protein n=1 Tax=Glonium stellatum TaxID=574774 RepID=A0A8E2JRN2_9PEZI|nr:MOSC-domain-containing protein [Glonium stellatum]